MKDLLLSLFAGYSDTHATPATLEQVVALIRTDADLKLRTEKHRTYLAQGKERAAKYEKEGCPCFAVAVRFRPEGKAKEHVECYTGLSLVDLDHIPTERMEEVRQRVEADPHTLLAYTTISGTGLRILFRLEGLSADVDERNCRLYTRGFRGGNDHYAALTDCPVDAKCKNNTRLSGLAHDPHLFFRPDAEPFVIAPAEPKKPQPTKGRRGALLPRAVKAAERTLAGRGVVYEPHRRNEYIMQAGYLLNGYGVPQEEATRWALERFVDYDGDIAAIFASCYRQEEEHGRLPLNPRAGKEERSSGLATVEEIEEFLYTHIGLRHNVVTGRCEYAFNSPLSTLHSPLTWYEIDDRQLNSLWCRICKEVKPTRIGDLRAVLHSDHAPLFHPFRDYFDRLPPWDGESDPIARLAATVHVKGDQAEFTEYFRKWLVASVAAWFEPETVNHEILVLVGPQGTFKTTWLSRLLPPELRRYFNVKTNNHRIQKDDIIAVAEFAFICMEELDGLSQEGVNQVKAITTLPAVNERAAYAHYKEHRPHFASFCGTTNNVQFLTDFTSNRRWLPFEIDHIESPYEHVPDYAAVYAHAYALWQKGFPYWFDNEEIKAINLRNLYFEVPCMEQELIRCFFRRPIPGEKREPILASNSYILNRINSVTRLTLNATKVSQAMKKEGYELIHTAKLRGYRLIELTAEEMERSRKVLAKFTTASDEE